MSNSKEFPLPTPKTRERLHGKTVRPYKLVAKIPGHKNSPVPFIPLVYPFSFRGRTLFDLRTREKLNKIKGLERITAPYVSYT
jgi:hypothetical protein